MVEKTKIDNVIIDFSKHAYIVCVDEKYDSNIIFDQIKKYAKKTLVKEDAEKICTLIDDSNFPDLKVIRPEGKDIKKEQLLDLMIDFNNSSYYNWKKIYIIEYAENLNQSSANTILKFLEEPENDIIAILITKNISDVLPTILSRCEIININNYVLKDYSNDIIEYAKNIIETIEKYKQSAISYMDDIYSKKNNELSEILQIMILMYEDILSYLTIKKILTFEKCSHEIITISKNCKIDDIIKKIEVLEKMNTLITTNVNSRVLLDSFFIGDYYE